MNAKFYVFMVFLMMQAPIFAMQCDNVAELRKKWEESYNCYSHAVDQHIKYYFLGFFIDPMMSREQRVVKSMRLTCHAELTFRVYRKAEQQLRAAYIERNGHDPLL